MTFEFGGRVGGYAIIGAQKRVVSGANMLVLDTNVVIDMSNFYFMGPRGRSVRPDLHALLSEFPDVRVGNKVDIKYGFAVEEASWVRGVGRDRPGYRRLMHAASTMIEWTRPEVEKTFANRHPPANRDKAGLSRVSLSAAEDMLGIPPLLLLPTYASFLYLCRLDRTRDRWRSKGPSVVMAKYIDWMVDNLGVIDVYAVQLGLDFLLGDDERRNGVRALLERGGNEAPDRMADRCWKAAWDVLFLRLTDGLTTGIITDPDVANARAFLVTRDVDPSFIRAQAELRAVVEVPTSDGRARLAVMELDWSKHPLIRRDTVVYDTMLRHMETVGRRLTKDTRELAGQVARTTQELEATLEVTKTALVGVQGLDD